MAGVCVRIADEAGACYGVERALDMVVRATEAAQGPVYTLGPLIHNPRVVADLAHRGVRVADAPEDARGATLLLRTHGVSPDEELRARSCCADVLDATCPFVKRVHAAAGRLVREGRQVVVVGEPGHPEVMGTCGHAPGAIVIPTADAAREAELGERVGVVVQTTIARATLEAVLGALRDRVDDLEVVDTICDATAGHQASAARLARESDVMVVVGGRNSANTTHLAQICAELCPTHHIESELELEASWFESATTVGITAGASTPAAHIEAVRAAICEMVGA